MFASITGPPSEKRLFLKRRREREKKISDADASAPSTANPGGVRARRFASRRFASRRAASHRVASHRPSERTEKRRRGLRPGSFFRADVRGRRRRFRRQPHVPPPSSAYFRKSSRTRSAGLRQHTRPGHDAVRWPHRYHAVTCQTAWCAVEPVAVTAPRPLYRGGYT